MEVHAPFYVAMWMIGDSIMPSIGADPELFLRDVNTGGVVPVCGLIGGSKDEPLPLDGMDDGFAVQEDNVMVEFNIPPASSAGRFSVYIEDALAAVENLIRIRELPLEFDYSSERLFSEGQLSHPQAREFGCSPDFDGYKMGAPCRPISPDRLGGWRFAGGHVHLGYDFEHVPHHVVAQLCDLFLGLPSVALDKQAQRRKRYGQPGRFRPTAYGIEYRTLSNFWIFEERLRREIGHRAVNVCRLASNPKRTHDVFSQVPWADVKSAITNEIDDLAADLVAYLRNDLNLEV
jgi:hypothetical protein